MGFLVAYSILYSTPKKFRLCPSYFDFSVSAHTITAWTFTFFCVHNFFITPKKALAMFNTSKSHVWAGRIGLFAGAATVICLAYILIHRHFFGVLLFVPESKGEIDTNQCPAAKSIFTGLETDAINGTIVHKIGTSEAIGLYIAVHHFMTMIIFGFLSIRKYRTLSALQSTDNNALESETPQVGTLEESNHHNDEEESTQEQMKEALNVHIICMKWLFLSIIFQPSMYFFKYVPRLVRGCAIFEVAAEDDGYCSQIEMFKYFVWIGIILQFLIMFLLDPQTFRVSVSNLFKVWSFSVNY
eukprot:CAMPEP_0194091222 /NCGR_PEP_ID=MMETSP0149-20130528/42028_1 /TAXON_ID=122233 /ORGANISM="Chaetoceros debilis, Strain MM31A-1" /LENGTH=298 /DNA_ID=CAMNT_0038775717 /DNA_START=90 /DNA_END=986 /DNA_ORIENTATION=-